MIDTLRIQEMIEELTAAGIATQIPIDGLNDLLSLDIIEPSRRAVQSELDALNARSNKITKTRTLAEAFLQAIDDLLANGYPELHRGGMTEEIRDDLNAQLQGIDAAIRLFVLSATSFTAKISPERPTPV